MSLVLYSCFDVEFIGSLSVELTDDSVASASVEITSGVFAHIALTSVTYDADASALSVASAFATALQTAMNAATSGGVSYAVTFNTTTLVYGITSTGTSSFDLAFTGASGTRLSRVLGITSVSGVTSATSTIRPFYMIRGDVGNKSDPVEREVDVVSEVGETDDGLETDGISYSRAAKTYDCMITWEPAEAVYAHLATVAVPWTWEHFFRHVRVHESFAIKDGSTSETTVHKLRKDGAAFRPEPAATDPNYVEAYNVRLLTYLRGRV